MVFSSIAFLFFFLPLLLIVYFIVPKKFRNLVLLIFSLIFYFFGEKYYLILLLFSCLINYIFGLILGKKQSKKALILALIINIGMLLYFKYTNFFIDTFNNIFNLNINTLNIILPLGISFFTFQNISYIVDIYRKDVEPNTNFLSYATYIALFPQLVAGPIVRYKDINNELKTRKESTSLFSEGITRFITGLGKKVLIADTLYNSITVLTKSNMSTLAYWIVALFYTLQIYYDFSGYSDMAIGLGRMFGFNFKENFNYPLISKSITEFWRRWHISLSSFFRDYVYFPLGGSRTTKLKTIRNISVVWLLTGFWHGANWNFILWGLYFLVFLLIEKFILKKYLKGGLISRIYTGLIVIISFVIFSITDMNELILFLKNMFNITNTFINKETYLFIKANMGIIIISLLGITPIFKEKLKKGNSKIIGALEVIFIIIVFILSISSLISSSFNPFIYFRF